VNGYYGGGEMAGLEIKIFLEVELSSNGEKTEAFANRGEGVSLLEAV